MELKSANCPQWLLIASWGALFVVYVRDTVHQGHNAINLKKRLLMILAVSISFKEKNMYYKLNNFVFIRNINNYLQIVDKRNDNEVIGDYYSYLFARNLDYLPKHIDTIVNSISSEFFNSVDSNIVKEDAIRFFERLIDFGFVSKSTNDFDFVNTTSEYINFGPKRILLPKDELEKYQFQKKQSPCLQNVVVEITQQCNERCIHCYIPHENKNLIMSDENFYNIVDMCSDMKTIVNFRITGGECMSHPSFKRFIKYVKERGFALVLLTNLTMLDDEIIEILQTGTLSQVQVSMFSVTPVIHDQITTISGSLEKTMRNIERLKMAGIPVTISTQVMDINKDSIEGLYEYAKCNNFDLRCDWTIIAKENRNKENLSYRISDLSNYRSICKLKLKHIDGYKDELREELLRNPKSENTHTCNAGTNSLYIDTNLIVHPCPGWDLPIGNLKNKTLSDIWNSSEVLQKVRNVVLNDFPKCAKCDIRNLCSLCMAQADLESSANNFQFEMPEYVCSMYRVIYDTIQDEVFHNQ